MRKGASETDVLVTVDNRVRAATADNKKDMVQALDRLADRELQLALLADLVDEFLVNYRALHKQDAKPQRGKARRKEGTHDE